MSVAGPIQSASPLHETTDKRLSSPSIRTSSISTMTPSIDVRPPSPKDVQGNGQSGIPPPSLIPYTPPHANPALSTLASVAAAPSSQLRAYENGHHMTYAATSGGGQGNNTPVCHNCSTSTTPLWRRDESGAVLCNACGLFFKLHGTPRPISLKTDVIKSRNRVKIPGGQGIKRKSPYENGLPASQSQHTNLYLAQQASQRIQANGADQHDPSSSRNGTPGLNHANNIAPQHIFDGVALQDHPYGLLRHPSPTSTSPNPERHLEHAAAFESLLQQNTALRTRVSELEVITGFCMPQPQQSHETQQTAPQADMLPQNHDTGGAELQKALDESRRREEEMRVKVEELEQQIAELKGEEPAAKKVRQEEEVVSVYPEPPTS